MTDPDQCQRYAERHKIILRQPEEKFIYDSIWTKGPLVCGRIRDSDGVDRYPVWRIVRIVTERWRVGDE